MEDLLKSYGISIGSNVIYDLIKTAITKTASKEKLVSLISSELNIQNAIIAADKIIEFAARNGDIIITGTHVYASENITMRSASNTKFVFGENSTSQTATSKISAGTGARIEGQGGATIVQGSDGSISFNT
ncbi:hemagglutinin repeat-containing protein [Aquirufa antheringensis]